MKNDITLDMDLVQRVLEIPNYSGFEYKLVNFLQRYFDSEGYWTYQDEKYNLFVHRYGDNGDPTESSFLLNSHSDGVNPKHQYLLEEGLNLLVDIEGDKISGRHPLPPNESLPLHLDDKLGIIILIHIFQQTTGPGRILITSQEENGMRGIEWVKVNKERPKLKDFWNIDHILSFDSIGDNIISDGFFNGPTFLPGTEFTTMVFDVIEQFIPDYVLQRHSYTCLSQLVPMVKRQGCNICNGVHFHHQNTEYGSIKTLKNIIELGIEIVNKLQGTGPHTFQKTPEIIFEQNNIEELWMKDHNEYKWGDIRY